MTEDLELKRLDERLVAAGMLPLSVMLSGNPIMVHSGISDLDQFEQWLNMRHKEMMKMKARIILNKKENDELYEWVLSYAAVLNEVVANFNAARRQN